MTDPIITTAAELEETCSRLHEQPRIGLDTEFVSEDTYRPQLCLIQLAARDWSVAIDTLAIEDLAPLWTALTQGQITTVVHSGREELLFCLRSVGEAPSALFDTQLAAGLCGTEYPASYSTLVARFLRHRPDKGETRTDWRRRPLTSAQIHYAMEDVRYLLPLHDALCARVAQLDRESWLATEMATWQEKITASATQRNWRRVSRIGGLSTRSLAIVRELWHWREQEAERRDLPPKRILRDDLIIELAKRQSARNDRIKAVRGMHHGNVRRVIPQISQAIQRGLEADLSELRSPKRIETPPQLDLLGQFLTPALTSICRQAEVASSLVGTATDVRELIAYRLGFRGKDAGETPALAAGWRADLVGKLIDDLLAGKKSIRIQDPRKSEPLTFDDVS